MDQSDDLSRRDLSCSEDEKASHRLHLFFV